MAATAVRYNLEIVYLKITNGPNNQTYQLKALYRYMKHPVVASY